MARSRRTTQVLWEHLRDCQPLQGLWQKASGYRVPYASFAEARAARAPKPIGYETCAGDLYKSIDLIPGDLAAMFWIERDKAEIHRLFDFGGNIGLQYYSYGKRMRFPEGMRWTVCDIDPFVSEGRKIGAGEKKLDFTYDFNEASGADFLLVSGCLHYLEESFGEKLAGLAEKPKRLCINRVPLCEGPTTVTLQDIGSALLPVVIRNRAEFLADIAKAGYKLEDEWGVPELQCTMPLYPERSAHGYRGFYFSGY